MPKELVSTEWVSEPCLFKQQSMDVCTLCERPFTWLNGPAHCGYCGRVFHRKDCSSKCRRLGALRTCTHCDDYRTVLKYKLCSGEVFQCVGNSQPLQLHLCEHTAELVLHWTALGLKETVDLLSVELRKGFTRHLPMISGHYEPLKSLSLVLRDGANYKVLELQSSCAWTCQLWADGLKAAQYIYQCMIHQERTKLYHLDQGIKVQRGWFTTNYLIENLTPSVEPRNTISNNTSLSSLQMVTSLTASTHCTPPLHTSTPHTSLSPLIQPFMSIDSGYSSDFHIPSSKPHRSLEVKGPVISQSSFPNNLLTSFTSKNMHSQSYDPTLPYRHSTLSEICRCHDYEVVPSRSIDVGSKVRSMSPRKCCRACVDICRIARDLDNL